jgi:N-methylhydantoinase B/oxoprolinase/acetone carboxylase alpha subunit
MKISSILGFDQRNANHSAFAVLLAQPCRNQQIEILERTRPIMRSERLILFGADGVGIDLGQGGEIRAFTFL